MNDRPMDPLPLNPGIRRRAAPGAPPGTLIADTEASSPTMTIVAYGPPGFDEQPIESAESIASLIGRMPVTWINVDGLGDLDLIRRLGEIFSIHGLALEDVVHTHQRPKADEYDDHLFIVTRMNPCGGALRSEQLSIFLGSNYVLTFQERPGDCFDPIRNRIRHGRGRIRKEGADYLAYALLDAVVDGFFPVLDAYDELLEGLEDAVLGRPTVDVVGDIHQARRELMTLKRSILPQQELFYGLIREENPLVTEDTRVHLRDCYDHVVRLADQLESHRETASALLEIYHSSLSTRMTESMKVLTVIATIFIPLTFVAGIYGMNFDPEASPWNMPELEWFYGYPFALGLMAIIAAALVLYFRRKGWIGSLRRGKQDTETGADD